MPASDSSVNVDAKTFQEPLSALAETMVQKVFREGTSHCSLLENMRDDIVMMLRYALSIYHLLFYLNADIRRHKDTEWHVEYGVSAMTLVRSLIDCLYNITLFLEHPAMATEYRKCGLKKVLDALDAERDAHPGDRVWADWHAERLPFVEGFIVRCGFTVDDVRAQGKWQTMGTYLGTKKPGGSLTPHQQFLIQFTHLQWKQYSALSHAGYEGFAGLLDAAPLGTYFMADFLPHELRPKVEERYELHVSSHLARAALLLLCIVTELQAYCKFDGAEINARICRVWDALVPLYDAKEIYDGRYAQLMADRGIRR
jgi:hypothetical protein